MAADWEHTSEQPEAEHISEEERARLEEKVKKQERRQSRIVVALIVALILLAANTAWTSYGYYTRGQQRTQTLSGLQDLAERGNCSFDKTAAFQDLVIAYFSTDDPKTREHELHVFQKIKPCSPVQIPKGTDP